MDDLSVHAHLLYPGSRLLALPPIIGTRTETLRFKEEGVFAVVKDVFLPWYNAYRFLVQVGVWGATKY